MADVAALIAQPPQYEQDPFYSAVLQQWLMANQGLTQKGIQRKPSSSAAWAGILGQLGGSVLGALPWGDWFGDDDED
jgi:hypothetical protein